MKISKTKIEWTDYSWNPVWGCLNFRGCHEYCYARREAKRRSESKYTQEFSYCFRKQPDRNLGTHFLQDLKDFYPTWLESNFDKEFPERPPSRIFVNSMSEIYYWKPEWMERVLGKIKQHPEHVFQFSTRFPGIYNQYEFPANCWLGITIDGTEKDIVYQTSVLTGITNEKDYIGFVSIEPILKPISFNSYVWSHLDWIIVGAETGNYRKNKVIPEIEWIYKINIFCIKSQIAFFTKNSLKKIFPMIALVQQFPES